MRILIITGGRIDESFALSLLQKEKFDHMIVVDGALAFWDKVERNPEIQCHFDHLVGDFDTISPNILENYLDREDIEVHRFNPEKTEKRQMRRMIAMSIRMRRQCRIR